LKVLFFARLREALGQDTLEIADADLPPTVGALRALVIAYARGQSREEFGEAMEDANVFCAVNRKVVDDNHAVAVGDEVAFYPPVTGG